MVTNLYIQYAGKLCLINPDKQSLEPTAHLITLIASANISQNRCIFEHNFTFQFAIIIVVINPLHREIMPLEKAVECVTCIDATALSAGVERGG